jgi:histone deacetylase 1/2
MKRIKNYSKRLTRLTSQVAVFSQTSSQIVSHVVSWYQPGAIVLQCGADSLAGDKLGCFNLSSYGELMWCLTFGASFDVML